ncbi:hypothetical protein Tco_1421123 [Tanacetum coccineum]
MKDHTIIVPYEAFACPCEVGDVVLRESYQPKTRGKLYYACPLSKPRKIYFECEFIWKEERVRLLISSPGSSSTTSFSPGVIMYDDMTYSMLLEFVVKRFNLDPNARLNLSFNLPAIEREITNDEDVEFFIDCATNSLNDEIPHLYVSPPKKLEARIIPGPTGILQKALLRKNADVMAGGHDNIMTTQEYVKKVNEDVSEDDHFTLGPWLSAIVHLNGEGVMPSGCLCDMKKIT